MSPPPDDPPSSLFRPEAVDAQRPKPYGDIVLLPDASSRWLALAALAVVAAIVMLMTFGEYTRRSTVTGQLHPSEGLIRVTSAQPGVVVERRAVDGAAVRRGDLLFVLTGDRLGPAAVEFQRDIAAQIEARRRSLEDDLRRIALAEQQEAEQLRRRESFLLAEIDQAARQAELAASRVRGAADAVARYQDLARGGYVSRDELLSREGELAEARARVQAQRRDQLALERELVATRRDAEGMRTRYATQRAELERAVLVARQEFTEVEARRRIVVTAPADGALTLVQAEVGQSIDPTRPLAHLVPASSTLVARLYVPSRAAGFVRPGTRVQIRYDSFPYQKFGQHTGRVRSVSTAAVPASELQSLSLRPELMAEPVFAVTAELPAQTIGAGATAPRLHSGMRVEADLLHETRRLYEWMLEPLFAMRARLETAP